MSGYSGNGELVLGSFKTIRAFRLQGKIDGPEPWMAISHKDRYDVNKEYVAECRSWGWDIPTMMGLLDIPPHEWSGTLITGVHYHGKTWEISLTRKRMKPEPSIVHFDAWRRGGPVEVTYHQNVVHEQHQYVVEDDKMRQCMIQHQEQSPVSGCSCGFYSFYDTKTMLERGTSYISQPSAYYFGVIENYGKVIHCDLGLRSEKMKILAVASWKEVDELLTAYPLDVFDASSPPAS